jgi:hypothetical protein
VLLYDAGFRKVPDESGRCPVSLRGRRYDPAEVVPLAREGRVVVTKHVAAWLHNHGYDVAETVREVVGALAEHGRWCSSCELVNGEAADEYVVSLEEDWYVKFWVDGDQVVLNVWSCCWDGVVH